MTTPQPGTFCVKDSNVVNVGTLRNVMEQQRQQTVAALNTLVKKDADSAIEMNNFPIKELPDLAAPTGQILGDPESRYAVPKKWVMENYATDQQVQNRLRLDGGTMTGKIVLDSDPVLPLHASTKGYVDTKFNSVPQPDLTPYAKTVDVNAADALKADKSTTYTKTEVDNSLALKADKSTTYTKTEVDNSLALKADKATTYTKSETDTLLQPYAKTVDVNAADALKADKDTTYTKTETDTLLTGKKNTGTFDTKIQNSTAQSAISCDSDRYVSIKSNGNKICDILEDEVNQGCTLSTTKRLNFVSTQPQTFYHNSPAALFNLKYSDDGNTVPGQLRYGQLQLAPSNTTTLNPAVTLSSSRINGLGTAGSLFLDSSYGTANVPLILAPQSLTDANANLMTMYRTTATLPAGTPKTTFSQSVGYASGIVPTNGQDFVTKTYVDSAVSGVPQPDLNPYVQKAGDTMTGPLVLAGAPTSDLQASSKKYVDDKVAAIPAPDLSAYLKKDGSVALTSDWNINGFRIRGSGAPGLANDLTTKSYVDGERDALQGQITNLESSKISQTDADTRYLKLSGGTLSGALNMGSQKITNVATATLGTEATNLQQVNAAINTAVTGLISQSTADTRYYQSTVPLNQITAATGNVSLNNNKITNLSAPTASADAATKAYVDTAVAGAGSGNSAFIVSADASKKLLADNTGIFFQENNSTHLKVRSGELETVTANADIFSTNSSATSNRLRFFSSGVPNQTGLAITNFTDGSDQKTRIACQRTGNADVYLDLSSTNQQIQVPSTSKLVRKDASILNFQDQEYVTKAYAVSLIGAQVSADGSKAQINNNGIFQVINAGDSTYALTLDSGLTAAIYGNSSAFGAGLKLRGTVDSTSGQIFLLKQNNVSGSRMELQGQAQYDQAYTPTIDSQLVCKGHLDTRINTRLASGASISALAAPTADFGFGNFKLTNLADPVNANDAANRQWVLAQLQALGVSSYPGTYTIRLEIGDVPSAVETWASTGDKDSAAIVTGVTYTNQSSSQGFYTVSLRTTPTGPFGTGNYEVLLSVRSLRSGTPSTIDNDLSIPIVANKTSSSFQVMVEEIGSVVQNIAIIAVLVPSP